jgi:hypothetical protein
LLFEPIISDLLVITVLLKLSYLNLELLNQYILLTPELGPWCIFKMEAQLLNVRCPLPYELIKLFKLPLVLEGLGMNLSEP